ncbi:Endonuclease/exonuclease/phosphatase [Kickxella alabastrina]|uniref:Endonuclease/exonuclease/phosphatase n=1 Tax=Kickxella alabastrina TaxID=61397 RepID=UPI00221ECFE3|nr:Endonuclease/exonuclease/phosphatase [Kickxella alabastrina]KAI7825763.1 Endonuclease/exonuclease/phosphatase [Kickxella alabastrina]
MSGKAVPTNKTMPTDYSFLAAAPADCYKVVTYNVNSLSAASKKGFKEYLAAEDPDMICLQETKANQPLAFLVSKKVFPYQYWNCSKTKKGYSGTAVFSKIKPAHVKYGLGDGDFDTEGRTITLQFGSFHLVACYVPNAGEKLVRLDRRLKWDAAMREYLAVLEATKPVVYAGDLNVAHHPIDLARPDTNKRSAGFTIEERNSFSAILQGSDAPRVDAFRHLYPDARAEGYTYFGYRANARANAVGWRLDYFVVSQPLLSRVSDVIVRNQCYGASDHVPVVLLLKRAAGDDAGDATAAESEGQPLIE